MPNPMLQSFLAGLAHEINQPLTTLSMTASMLQLLVEEGHEIDREKLQNRLGRITREVDRMAGILDHVRELGHCAADAPAEPVLVGQVVSRVLALLGAQLNAHGIYVDVGVNGPATTVQAQPLVLEWILLEVLTERMAALDASGLSQKKMLFQIDMTETAVALQMRDSAPAMAEGGLADLQELIREWGATATLESTAEMQCLYLTWTDL